MAAKLSTAAEQKAERFLRPSPTRNSLASCEDLGTRTLSLAREKRIRKRRDFLRVQKFGFRAFGRFVVVIGQHAKN
ncbi:MAG TPA: hypothetical protein VEL47_00700, partial [Myxococcota bacterium]|nr:hypothetical protein [Myxococcota bacterium]